jgi:hypothetical protein
MDNPGIYSLGDFTIGAAGTQTGTAIEDLGGMTAVTLSARLAYGSGGTSVVVVVQTSLNQGTTWVDVARVDFATAGAEKVINLSGLTPRTTPLSVAALGAEGCNDGVLGDRLRAVVTSTGTYAGSTVASVRASVR